MANGLTVQLQGTSASELPELVYAAGSSSPLDIVFELANESAIESLPVDVWQIGLSIGPEATSTGGIAFESVFAPDGSLFGSDPGPSTLEVLPVNAAVVYDIAPMGTDSVSIPAESATPIVTLRLKPTNDASGDFVLTMAAFNVEDLDRASYWADAIDFEFRPFDNPTTAAEPIELAIIRLVESSGDFNEDLKVDAADYTVWRDGLGSLYSEEGYEIWKQHFGEVLSGGTVAPPAPEPANAWLILIGVFTHAISLRSRVVASCSLFW